MNTHRGRTSPPVKREPPTHVATSPNQVWTSEMSIFLCTCLTVLIINDYMSLT